MVSLHHTSSCLVVMIYLDGTAVDQQSVESRECLGSTLRLAEGDIGDTSALGVGAVGQFNLLDGADRLNKVFLGSK